MYWETAICWASIPVLRIKPPGRGKKSLWSHGAYNLMKDTNDKQNVYCSEIIIIAIKKKEEGMGGVRWQWWGEWAEKPPLLPDRVRVRKIPWRRKWLSSPVFLSGDLYRMRSLAGYSPWGHKEWNRNEWHTFSYKVRKVAEVLIINNEISFILCMRKLWELLGIEEEEWEEGDPWGSNCNSSRETRGLDKDVKGRDGKKWLNFRLFRK